MTSRLVDRRIERTRTALRTALLELMQERGWDEIDVQTLCARANVGRSTFYQHFPNKEELLKASFAGLKSALMAEASSNGTAAGALGFVPALVDHVHEMQHLFRALLVRRSAHYVQDRFSELLIEMVLAMRRQRGDHGKRPLGRTTWLARYSSCLFGGWAATDRISRAKSSRSFGNGPRPSWTPPCS